VIDVSGLLPSYVGFPLPVVSSIILFGCFGVAIGELVAPWIMMPLRVGPVLWRRNSNSDESPETVPGPSRLSLIQRVEEERRILGIVRCHNRNINCRCVHLPVCFYMV